MEKQIFTWFGKKKQFSFFQVLVPGVINWLAPDMHPLCRRLDACYESYWKCGCSTTNFLSTRMHLRYLIQGFSFAYLLFRFVWWSRGNMLASRSKVRGFKPGWGRWIFSGYKNLEHKSSGRNLSWGSRFWYFRFDKESQAWKNGFMRTI